MVKGHSLILPKEQRSCLNVNVDKNKSNIKKNMVKWWLHTVCQALCILKDHYIQSFVGQIFVK